MKRLFLVVIWRHPREARGRAIRYKSGLAQAGRTSGFPLLSLAEIQTISA